MSTNGVSTGTPTAETDDTPPPTKVRTEVDVVNHEIEHDGDVRAARIERREPVALDEARLLDVRQRRANRAIESLDVPGLHERTRAAARWRELIGLVQGRGDRLLDQHVNAALQRRGRGGEVRRRRHDDAQRVDRIEERVERRKSRDAKLTTHSRGALGAAVMKTDERRAGDVAENSRVVEAECPRPDHTDPDWHQTTDPRSLRSKKAKNSLISGNCCNSATARSRACERFSSDLKKRR
jgi:hypothetical protein